MTTPLISIVIATYNAAATLERCLSSIVAQTYLRRHLLLIDGGSTDGTLEVIRAHPGAIDHWTSEPDRGIYDAWNKALPHVRGEWVYFLGADDVLRTPTVLERAAEALAGACPRHRVVYGAVDWVAEDGRVVGGQGAPWAAVERKFRHYMAIPHQGTFHHRSLFEEHGPFDPRFKISGDYEFLLRHLLEHDPLFIPDLTVAAMQVGGINERQRWLRDIETQQARHTHGLFASQPWFPKRLVPMAIRGRVVLETLKHEVKTVIDAAKRADEQR